MFLEKNNSPGKIINLYHVASMNWDKGLATVFIMANGHTIIWQYDNEDEQMADLDKLNKYLHNADKLLSVELDKE